MLHNSPADVPGKKTKNYPVAFVFDHASFTGIFLAIYVDLIFDSLLMGIVDLFNQLF